MRELRAADDWRSAAGYDSRFEESGIQGFNDWEFTKSNQGLAIQIPIHLIPDVDLPTIEYLRKRPAAPALFHPLL